VAVLQMPSARQLGRRNRHPQVPIFLISVLNISRFSTASAPTDESVHHSGGGDLDISHTLETPFDM
jgi:hypothetical protein